MKQSTLTLLVICLGLFGSVQAQTTVLEGEVTKADTKSFMVDVVRAEWPSYFGKSMPLLWNAGCEVGGFFEYKTLCLWELVSPDAAFTVDGASVAAAAFKQALVPGRRAVVQLDGGAIVSVTLSPWRANRSGADGLLVVTLKHAVVSVAEPHAAKRYKAAQARKPLKQGRRDVVLRIDPQTKAVLAFMGRAAKGSGVYPAHPLAATVSALRFANGALSTELDATVLPTFKEEAPDPVSYRWTIKATMTGGKLKGTWSAAGGEEGVVTGVTRSRPSVTVGNATLILRAMGRYHPSGREAKVFGNAIGMNGVPDPLDEHFDTLVVPIRDGVSRSEGAEMAATLEFPRTHIKEVAIKASDSGFAGSVTYVAESGTFTTTLKGVTVGSYAQAEFVTHDAAGKEVKRGLCKGRVWPVESPPQSEPIELPVPPIPKFGGITLKVDDDRAPGARLAYLAGDTGDEVVEEVLVPGIYHDGWYPSDRLPASKPGEPAQYRLRYTTDMQVEKAGTYQFRITTKAHGVPIHSFSVDGQAVDLRRAERKKTNLAEVTLTAGTHRLEVIGTGVPFVFERSGPDAVWYDCRFGPFSIGTWAGMHRRRLVVFLITGDSNIWHYDYFPATVDFRSSRGWVEDNRRDAWAPGLMLAKDGKTFERRAVSPANVVAEEISHALAQVPDVHIGTFREGRVGGWLGSMKGKKPEDSLPRKQVVSIRDRLWGCQLAGAVVLNGGIGDAYNTFPWLVTACRRAFGVPELPYILRSDNCRSGPWSGLRTEGRPQLWTRVSKFWIERDAAFKTARAMPGVMVVDNIGLPLMDDHHLDTVANREQGRRLGHQFLALDSLGLAARNLAHMPVAIKQRGRLNYPVSDDPKKTVANFNLTLTRVSQRRTVEQLAPYRNCYAVFEYEVCRKALSKGGHAFTHLQVVHQTIKDGKYLPAYKYQVGEKRKKMKLRCWGVQPDSDKVALDDDIQNVDAPLYIPDGESVVAK